MPIIFACSSWCAPWNTKWTGCRNREQLRARSRGRWSDGRPRVLSYAERTVLVCNAFAAMCIYRTLKSICRQTSLPFPGVHRLVHCGGTTDCSSHRSPRTGQQSMCLMQCIYQQPLQFTLYSSTPLLLIMQPSTIFAAAADASGQSLPLKAYEPTIEMRDRKSRSVFIEATYSVETGEAERIAVDWTAKGGSGGTSRKSPITPLVVAQLC